MATRGREGRSLGVVECFGVTKLFRSGLDPTAPTGKADEGLAKPSHQERCPATRTQKVGLESARKFTIGLQGLDFVVVMEASTEPRVRPG